MARRKKEDWIDVLFKLFGIFVLFIFASYFFKNQAAFWSYVSRGFLFLIGIIFLVTFFKRKRFSGLYSGKDITKRLRGLKPKEFEEFVADLFRKHGYQTEAIGSAYDGGIDVIAIKDGVKNFIQCKKFITQQVSVGAMRDFYGAIIDKLQGGKGYFVTTNIFTLEAEQFAKDKPIELIDGQKLLEYIKRLNLESTIPESHEIAHKICPKCGGEMKKRNGKYGEFYGCSNYPRCKYTENIK